MKASEAYMEYCAIKAHFERPSYDYYKYMGRVRSGNYEERKDKKWFFRMSRALNTKQLHEFYIANFLVGNTWVGNMTKEAWYDWKRKMVRLPEVYEDDLRAIKQYQDERGLTLKQIFRVIESGQHPHVLRLFLGGHLQIETFAILGRLTGMIDEYDMLLANDPIWDQTSKKVKKYSSVLENEFARDTELYRVLTKRNLLNSP